MEDVKYLEVIIEVERIKGEKNGNKYDFLTYKGVDKNGKKVKFKLTKEATKTAPNEVGLYKCKIAYDKINKDRSTIYNEYWIREIASYSEYVRAVVENDDDLPF